MSNTFLKFICLQVPPAEICQFWKYFIAFISIICIILEQKNLITVSIISFLTVFLQNLYFRWPSFYRKVIEII